MATEIQDGTGSGARAKVNKEGRLTVDAVTDKHITHEAKDDGEAYVLASGFIDLTTTGSFNGLMYIKNLSSDKHFHIQRLRVCGGATGSVQFKILKNASTGTLISDANAAYSTNSNFASGNELEGRCTVLGASGDGKTVTDGEYFTQFIQKTAGHSIQEYDGIIMLHKNHSLAIVAKPSAAMTVCVEVLGYYEEHH